MLLGVGSLLSKNLAPILVVLIFGLSVPPPHSDILWLPFVGSIGKFGILMLDDPLLLLPLLKLPLLENRSPEDSLPGILNMPLKLLLVEPLYILRIYFDSLIFYGSLNSKA